MKQMSIGFSLARFCTSVRCRVFGRARTNSSSVTPSMRQPVLADRLDMLGPRVDQGDVEAVMREVPAGIPADRPGAEHDNPLVRHLSAPLDDPLTDMITTDRDRRLAVS